MKPGYIFQFVLVVLMASGAFSFATAQKLAAPDSTTFPLVSLAGTQVRQIQSKFTNTTYQLSIEVPDYKPATGEYSVLYLLDGDWNFALASNCLNAIGSDLRLEQPLIVGIGYGKGPNQRARDYLPGQGANQFLQFLERELMPFIAQNYPITDRRVLHSYSFGGVFATYALFQRPTLFEGIIIGSPGNNGNELVPQEKEYARSYQDLPVKVFIGVGSQEPIVVNTINEFAQALSTRHYSSLQLHTAIIDSAGHGLALPQLTLKALQWLYVQPRKRMAINPELLARYAGHYRLQQDGQTDIIHLGVHEGRLYYLNSSNERLAELIPSSENEFYVESDFKLIVRLIEDKGSGYKLIADRLTNQFEYQRVK